MHLVLLAAPVVLTSAGAYLAGKRWLGLAPPALGRALGPTLERVGATLVFYAANLLVGMAAILGIRSLGLGFVSLYIPGDVTVLALSLLQGLVFESWRELSRTLTAPR